jgi:hypothetical protein
MSELSILLTLLLIFGMPLCMELGRRVRLAHTHSDHDSIDFGVGALDAAVYALFGLLLAFIFSGAASRFELRRDLIAQETNAIGTAYLRLDLLAQERQDTLRPLFRRYVESRLAIHRLVGSDLQGALTELQKSQALQNDIWRLGVIGARETGNPAVLTLTLTALNDMIDVTTTRLAAMRNHPPSVIYGMLVIVAFASSFLSGMAMAKSPVRPWPHILAFTLVISATVFVILDIEHPRSGFVKVNSSDQVMVDLLAGMQ